VSTVEHVTYVPTFDFINDLFQLVVVVDKRILTYSPRERSWVWDIDEIHDECVTPNVLDLLGAKMAACSSGVKVSIIECFQHMTDAVPDTPSSPFLP
jgi:hypothetical protein